MCVAADPHRPPSRCAASSRVSAPKSLAGTSCRPPSWRRDRIQIPFRRPCCCRPSRRATAHRPSRNGGHAAAVMSAAFLAGVAAGYGIAVPVGAIGVLIVALSARMSLRVGAAAGLGAATADGVYALNAVLGGAVLADVIAP